MRLFTFCLPLLSICLQPVHAQEIGKPFRVDLAEGSTTVTLDFSDRDYELILYSARTDAESGDFGLAHPFNFSITAAFGDSRPIIDRLPGTSQLAPLPNSTDLKSKVREQEQELARRLQDSGGYRAHAAKIVPQQIGSAHQFAFPSFGDVRKTTITASFLATSERANAYVDVSDVHRISKSMIQEQIDRFSNTTYPIVTSMIGQESDVDNDGKIHILYTNKVNPDNSIFGAAAFFNAASLLSVEQGGDGNLSDLLYIDPDTDPGMLDAVLAHEFQHLINFNQHALVRNGNAEHHWLNEGLSHVAEDLVGEHDKHNRRNVDRYLKSTERGTIGNRSPPNSTRRGAAYLFLRSLVEEFGTGVLARLAQTEKVGIANVENATGHRISDIFERHVSRLFLSGLGLNTRLNYTTTLLADSLSLGRAFPIPAEHIVWPDGGYEHSDRGNTAVRPESSGSVTVKGEIFQLSSTYVRLIGNRNQTILSIQTDPNGKIRVQFIPLPKNYHPRMDIPRGYWPRVYFDPPLPFQYRTGQAMRLSGSVSDSSLSEVVHFEFENEERRIRLEAKVSNGRFSRNISFTPEEIGDYRLIVSVSYIPFDPQKWWENSYTVQGFRHLTVVQGETPIPDFDRDGTVAFPDFIAFARAFGGSSADEDFDPAFDLDEDGEVGFSDFVIFSNAFGSQPGS